MSSWTDNRNHLLDDVIHDMINAAVALAIGAESARFAMPIIAARKSQSRSP